MNNSFATILIDQLETVSGGAQPDMIAVLRACAAGAHAQGEREAGQLQPLMPVGPLDGRGMKGCLAGVTDLLNPRLPEPGPVGPSLR